MLAVIAIITGFVGHTLPLANTVGRVVLVLVTALSRAMVDWYQSVGVVIDRNCWKGLYLVLVRVKCAPINVTHVASGMGHH